jgi:hypothetical protein
LPGHVNRDIPATGRDKKMARDLTPYQRGIVRNYYERKDGIMNQKLAETISALSVCEDEKEYRRLWKSAETVLGHLDVPEAKARKIVAERDLEGLAELAGQLF